MMGDWGKIEEEGGRENPGDLIDEVILEVLGQYYIETGTVVNKDTKNKLINVVEDVTNRDWDVREV